MPERELDPQAAAIVETVEALPVPPTFALSVESACERLADFFGGQTARPVAAAEEFSIPGPEEPIDVRLYLPDRATPPLVVFYHGGGWVLGGLESYDPLCRALVDVGDVAVLSVDYRLAPEHPFPAGFEDAYAAAAWAAEHADRLNCDPDRLAVAGDSAGGNLAAAVCLAARDRNGPAIDAQALIYPSVAAPGIHTFESHVENGEGYFLERESIAWFFDRYLADTADRRTAYVAPLLAQDLSGLPPATVLTAGFGPLRDEGEAYTARLEAADVPVRRESFPGMIHGFVSMLDDVDRAEDRVAAVAEDLAATLAE
jgi:acetyl esterase